MHARRLSNTRSFIILLSGEGLSSFSINNRANVFGEKSKMKLSEVCFLFWNTRNNFKLNLLVVLVLVVKSQAL